MPNIDCLNPGVNIHNNADRSLRKSISASTEMCPWLPSMLLTSSGIRGRCELWLCKRQPYLSLTISVSNTVANDTIVSLFKCLRLACIFCLCCWHSLLLVPSRHLYLRNGAVCSNCNQVACLQRGCYYGASIMAFVNMAGECAEDNKLWVC
jgi:hypothetical protein